MAKLSKKQKSALAKFDKTKVYSLEEAVSVVKDITYTKFDASFNWIATGVVLITKSNDLSL